MSLVGGMSIRLGLPLLELDVATGKIRTRYRCVLRFIRPRSMISINVASHFHGEFRCFILLDLTRSTTYLLSVSTWSLRAGSFLSWNISAVFLN